VTFRYVGRTAIPRHGNARLVPLKNGFLFFLYVELHGQQLTGQVRNIAEVATAIANGDLSKKITVDVRGEILQLKETLNTMVEQLRSFAAEVTRVAREVGTDGRLGGQANVPGVAGTWKDLTDSVNAMAGNLTGQGQPAALGQGGRVMASQRSCRAFNQVQQPERGSLSIKCGLVLLGRQGGNSGKGGKQRIPCIHADFRLCS
jgi:hypothetical protein